MDRRTFVKTCVGVAAGGAIAASGLSMAAGLAIPRKAGGALIRYYGAHRVGGPAPRGVPLIPITVEDGKFVGKTSIPKFEGEGEQNVLDWYKYCGHASAPGLSPEFTKDNTLTYFIAEEKLKAITPWFKDFLGEPIRPEHFPADNFGASFVWRSKGQAGTSLISGVIIRAQPEGTTLGPNFTTSVKPPAKPLKSKDEYDFVRKNVHHENFIAVSTYCTHFCCVPGYREAEALARPRDAWDNMFCTCHNSNYDFRQPVAYTFSPEVTAAAGEGGFDPLLTHEAA
jgi:Rieske Fe-S protein